MMVLTCRRGSYGNSAIWTALPGLVECGFAVEPYGAGKGLVFADRALLKISRRIPAMWSNWFREKRLSFRRRVTESRKSVGDTTFRVPRLSKEFFTGKDQSLFVCGGAQARIQVRQ